MEAGGIGRLRAFGLIGGPVMAAIVAIVGMVLGGGAEGGATGESVEAVRLGPAGVWVLALAVWMVVWWLTEAVDVAVTALLPAALLPLGTVIEFESASAAARAAIGPYANPNIALFFGGFIVGLAMERSGLHRRIALGVLRLVGSKPRAVVAGFMGITAFLSMWISNTATAVMMLPIAMSVAAVFEPDEPEDGAESGGVRERSFSRCLLLGIAYAASVGGLGTLIGTPPNVFLAAFVRDTYGVQIGFADWLLIGLPIVFVFVPVIWLLLTNLLFKLPSGASLAAGSVIGEQWQRLGPVRRDEMTSLIVFLCTATAWIARPQIARIEIGGLTPFAGITDAGIALLAAVALFALPTDNRRGRFAMDWESTRRLPWGVLLLFGGGLSLAGAIERHGVAEAIASQSTALGALPTVLIVVAIATSVIFLTELTSNTATTATILPVLAGMATAIEIPAATLLVPAAIAASCAFMMPAATPPNAVIFGSGRLTVPVMCRAGILLNLLGIGVVTAVTYGIALRVLSF